MPTVRDNAIRSFRPAMRIRSFQELLTGYLSRILRGFERRGLVDKKPSKADGRQNLLSLTARGRKIFAPLNARSHDEVAAMLSKLPAAEQSRLIGAMRTIEGVLGARTAGIQEIPENALEPTPRISHPKSLRMRHR